MRQRFWRSELLCCRLTAWWKFRKYFVRWIEYSKRLRQLYLDRSLYFFPTVTFQIFEDEKMYLHSNKQWNSISWQVTSGLGSWCLTRRNAENSRLCFVFGIFFFHSNDSINIDIAACHTREFCLHQRPNEWLSLCLHINIIQFFLSAVCLTALEFCNTLYFV